MNSFNADAALRKGLFDFLLPKLENYYGDSKAIPISSNWPIPAIKDFVQAISFDHSNQAEDVLNHVLKGMTEYAVHTSHPNYFGLFNPRSNFVSVLADLITATFNPQLAAWSHAPFANEVENYVIHEFGRKFGYNADLIDGTFCAGGAESNLTALICALNRLFPSFNETGIHGIEKQPVIYASTESHHSIIKAARVTGMGAKAVRAIPVNKHLQLDTDQLKEQICVDREKGFVPIMLIGTAGTTGAGAMDDLKSMHKIATNENLWFHVDAAYGGALAISEKYKAYLSGIELSDSITLDLHKWFSVPMGASLFLTSDKNILHQSFQVQTNYMPDEVDPNRVTDPYVHSIQWSRRFIGLKIFLPLAMHNWSGYEQIIDKQIEMGFHFKDLLNKGGWKILNDSPLPIICFSRKDFKSGKGITQLVNEINESGKAWISEYVINGQPAVRVCLTNYLTGMVELNEFIQLIGKYCELPTG